MILEKDNSKKFSSFADEEIEDTTETDAEEFDDLERTEEEDKLMENFALILCLFKNLAVLQKAKVMFI